MWSRPLLIVVSAPSGAGKTTLCRRLLEEYPEVAYSVSCTTRSPRGREVDGLDYRFLDRPAFDAMVAAGGFLEFAEVHGARYGTPRAPVCMALQAGRSVLMDIDVQGAAKVRDLARAAGPQDPLGRAFVDVFIVPPSLEELRKRLEARGEDAAETIERRLRNARIELESRALFRHVIVNDQLDRAYGELVAVLHGEGGGQPHG